MCGRYIVADDLDGIAGESLLSLLAARGGAGEIFPGTDAPVLSANGASYEASLAEWGFPTSTGSILINARSETVAEKPSFSLAFRESRCLLPTNGFFEWGENEDTGRREKYLFTPRERGTLYLGGLLRVFDGGAKFVIITTAANADMAGVHPRMPLTVRRGDALRYLTDREFARNLLTATQVPLDHALYA